MEKRIAVIGIIIENRDKISKNVNSLLGDYGRMIVGRMGVPYSKKGVSVISLIVDGTNNEIGALTGKLGNIEGVSTRVAVIH